MNVGDRSTNYQIRLQGHLDERWLRWFEGLEDPCFRRAKLLSAARWIRPPCTAFSTAVVTWDWS